MPAMQAVVLPAPPSGQWQDGQVREVQKPVLVEAKESGQGGGTVSEKPEYRIERVSDFCNVPPDRLDACLSEFKEFIDTAAAIKEMCAIAGEMAGVDPECEITAFVWRDDGERNATITLIPQESK